MRILRLIKSLFEPKRIAQTRSRFRNERLWKNDDGYLNRMDGPAVESDNGEKRWYRSGSLCRINGPTIEYEDGVLRWTNGKVYGMDKFTYGYSKAEIDD